MQRFAALFDSLDTTTSTHIKLDAMVDYFRAVNARQNALEADEAAWTVYVLMGRRCKRIIGQAMLRGWLTDESGLPVWLVDETYGSVGDLAETIALLVATSTRRAAADVSLARWFTERLLPLALETNEVKRSRITGWWRELDYRECFLVNKLLTGSLRVGVSRALVARALTEALGHERVGIERALIGDWQPGAEYWNSLARGESTRSTSQPYPFHLASPLDGAPEALGPREDWLAEWKWDGIRGQIVRRSGETTLWSRGEEIITERFPEIVCAAAALPDGTILDGEVLAARGAEVLPFAKLQQRIGRRTLSAKLLSEIPARFVAYDLLELKGRDLRARPLRERRTHLEQLIQAMGEAASLSLSPSLPEISWDALAAMRAQARARNVEGLMLKAWSSKYGVGRQRGAWWKWKLEPFVFDGVLLYAAPGHGRRSNLYTDYTFGVWHQDALGPVAKAYSGLTDAEIRSLDRWIRTHTRERFGTVRSVEPAQVFELAYEGIASSSRHKSGIALRFPRMLRWRHDKTARAADTLESLRRVLTSVGRAA
jgi:DNA ligase-1